MRELLELGAVWVAGVAVGVLLELWRASRRRKS